MVKETQHIMTHLFFSFFFAKMKTLALSAIFIYRPVAVSTHHELSGILTLLAAMGYGGRGAKEGKLVGEGVLVVQIRRLANDMWCFR